MKYKLKIKEEESDAQKYQQSRINAFDDIEGRLETLKKSLRLVKIDTIKYYRDNPTKYTVVYGTDLIDDYLNDMETLLQQ